MHLPRFLGNPVNVIVSLGAPWPCGTVEGVLGVASDGLGRGEISCEWTWIRVGL
jgi:hypothetical protein